nr:RNA polymerase sigma factor SigE [Nocardioides sediminis]
MVASWVARARQPGRCGASRCGDSIAQRRAGAAGNTGGGPTVVQGSHQWSPRDSQQRGGSAHRVLSGPVPRLRKARALFKRRTTQQGETVDHPTGTGSTDRGVGVVPTWDEVVEQHSDRVFRLAYRLTGNRHDAEDLTQEVFVRVFRSLDSYTPGTFEGWLHRITTNLFLDGARRKQRIRFDALSDERAARLESASPAPDAAYADQTFDDDIESALATLPPDFRAAVVLCDVEGLTYEEIAEIMDAKLGTVRSRIHRGRAMLRGALAHRAPVDGRQRYAGPAPADEVGVAR